MPAFKRYLAYVAAAWGAWGGAKLIQGPPPTPNEWLITLLDDSDQAGALGYHDFTPQGKPIGKVFAKTDLQYGYSIPVTLTHELAEMIADPYISRCEQTGARQAYATELGDPVERDEYGFKITTIGKPSVLCSDFVLPAWFIPGAPGPYDHAGHITSPLQVLPGGYAQFIDVGGWHQVGSQGEEMPIDPHDMRFRDRTQRHTGRE